MSEQFLLRPFYAKFYHDFSINKFFKIKVNKQEGNVENFTMNKQKRIIFLQRNKNSLMSYAMPYLKILYTKS